MEYQYFTFLPPSTPPSPFPQIFLHAASLDASHSLGFTLDLYGNLCLQTKVCDLKERPLIATILA